MFNFTANKKQSEPNLNTAVVGAGGADKTAPKRTPEEEAYANARIKELESQLQEFAKQNPDFDMTAEMDNPQFVKYVWRNGLTIEEAYFLAHRDEILQEAVSESYTRMANRRDRIAENGAGKNSPASVKKNPKEMSDEEVDAIIERVRNGEKISF